MDNENSEFRYLYKYRAIDENTKRIITDNELFFNNPEKFNDPYDCNIPIENNPSEEDVKKHMMEQLPDSSEEELAQDVKKIKSDPNYVSRTVQQYLHKNCGICCFSTLYDSILMWSHYADYHKGICFKFDTNKDPDFFRIILPVHYSQILPRFDLFTCDGRVFEKLVQTKYAVWSYESEIRIFKGKKDLQNNMKNKKTADDELERVFKFKSEALEEIIFGEKTSDEDIKIIKKLCEKSGKEHVKFSRMKLVDGIHYGLERVDLN